MKFIYEMLYDKTDIRYFHNNLCKSYVNLNDKDIQ